MNRQICKTVLGSFIGAVFIAVAPITAEAQVGQITGTVRDQDTGGPLATVQVYLQGTSRGTLSDQNGRFVLGDVPPGSYTLIAQRIGYREYRQAEIDVAAGQTLGVALFEAVRETPDYQADLAVARAEVAHARTLGRLNPGCAAERAALQQRPS